MSAFTDLFTTRCLPGWRGVACVIDNCTPHRELPREPGHPDWISTDLIGRFGFRWACRLHHWVGTIGYDDE